MKRVLLLALLIGCATTGISRVPPPPTLYVQMRIHSQAAVYIDGRRIGTVYHNRPCIELRHIPHISATVIIRALNYTVITEPIPLSSRDGWIITIDGVRPVFDAISIQPAERCVP